MTDIRDILLFMVSYPYRTPGWALDASLALAERCSSSEYLRQLAA
jgi:hypothetical protein